MSEAEIEELVQKIERLGPREIERLMPTKAEIVRHMAKSRGMYVVGGSDDPTTPEER